MTKITIFVFGNSHYDPVFPLLLRDAFLQFKRAGVEVIFAKEDNPNSLDNEIKELLDLITLLGHNILKLMSKVTTEIPDIQAFTNLDQFFELLADPKIMKQLSDKENYEHYLLNFITYNYYKNKLSLLMLLKTLDIPKITIDYSTERMNVIKAAKNKLPNTLEIIQANEQSRTNTMTCEILELVPSLFETGGIIFVEVGFLHAHRLMAKLSHALKSPYYSEKTSFQIIGAKVHPDNLNYHLRDARETFLQSLMVEKHLKNNDESQIQNYYTQNPINEWFWSNSNKQYSCKDLTNCLQQIQADLLKENSGNKKEIAAQGKDELTKNKAATPRPTILFQINSSSSGKNLAKDYNNDNDRATRSRMHRNTLFD